MADARVAPVPPLRVRAIQLTDGTRQVWLSRAEHQMRMIWHQADHPRVQFELFGDLAEDLEIARKIQIVQEDAHLVIPPRHDVIGEACSLKTNRSCHAAAHFQNRANRICWEFRS